MDGIPLITLVVQRTAQYSNGGVAVTLLNSDLDTRDLNG
jgi:hypothetical protein